MAHACNPCTWEAEAGGWEIQSNLGSLARPWLNQVENYFSSVFWGISPLPWPSMRSQENWGAFWSFGLCRNYSFSLKGFGDRLSLSMMWDFPMEDWFSFIVPEFNGFFQGFTSCCQVNVDPSLCSGLRASLCLGFCSTLLSLGSFSFSSTCKFPCFQAASIVPFSLMAVSVILWIV
jgi:hypothetical protein